MKVVHESASRRFVTVVDGQQGELEYRLSGSTMTIVHTGVPVALRGRGIGGELVRSALETARANGWKVVPVCSFAARFLRGHPGYGDLVA